VGGGNGKKNKKQKKGGKPNPTVPQICPNYNASKKGKNLEGRRESTGRGRGARNMPGVGLRPGKERQSGEGNWKELDITRGGNKDLAPLRPKKAVCRS